MTYFASFQRNKRMLSAYLFNLRVLNNFFFAQIMNL
jgi:hypothetical protein